MTSCSRKKRDSGAELWSWLKHYECFFGWAKRSSIFVALYGLHALDIGDKFLDRERIYGFIFFPFENQANRPSVMNAIHRHRFLLSHCGTNRFTAVGGAK